VSAANLISARAGMHMEGEYIVVLKDSSVRVPGVAASANRPDVVTMAASMANTYGLQADLAYTHALRGFTVKNAKRERIEKLLSDPRVDYVQENGIVYANATQTGATWGIDRVDQRDLPLNQTYNYDTTASNVHAYIIDTGIRGTHTNFGGRVSGGYTSITDGQGTNDCNGHGTHVAGTVGSATYGIAKAVQLHPVRVLNCQGSGTDAGVIAGVDWVTANHVKPAVANMSLGGGASTALDQAVTNLWNAGVFVAVAAGNDNSNACNYSPARAAAVFTVGSTTSTDARSSFSNYGTCLDIFAPGSSIMSTWSTSDTATNTISGTSMASPHVAGVGALYLAANPAATPSQVGTAIINASTPNKVTSPQTGSPNRLLYSLFGGTPTDTPPVANFTFSCSSLTCSFNGSSSTDDNGISSYSWTFGDGTTGSGATVSKTYSAAGTYSVTLTVRDTINQSGTKTQSVTVGTSGNQLQNGVPVTGLAASTGQTLNYTMAVPAGASNLKFVISGGTGDADLYVKFGSAPTTTSYDCRPYLSGNNETCNIATAQAGTYYVMVRAYTSFSGVSLTGSYSVAGPFFQNTNDYAINDHATVESPIGVTGVSGNAPSTLKVGVNIVHTYIGDLKVDLVAPDGSIYTLHNRAGGSADNINTTYTVNASSEVANGTWKLRVNDNASLDTGYINSWSLQF
jgi:serine protease